MGWLRKRAKAVKKGLKKFAKRMKKSFKKLNFKKVLKIAAIVGAVLVTGGAALGAFPGLAATKIGSAIITAGNWVTSIPFLGKAFVPFSKAGAFLGESIYTAGARMGFIKDVDIAAKAIESAGGASFASTKAALEAGTMTTEQLLSQANALSQGTATTATLGSVPTLTKEEIAKLGTQDILGGTTAQAATFTGAAGTTAPLTNFGQTAAQATGNVIGGFGSAVGGAVGSAFTSAAGGYLAQKIAGEPDPVGQVGPGYGEEYALNKLNDVQVAYQNADVNINEAYAGMDYGIGSLNYLSSPLYQQQILSIA